MTTHYIIILYCRSINEHSEETHIVKKKNSYNYF